MIERNNQATKITTHSENVSSYTWKLLSQEQLTALKEQLKQEYTFFTTDDLGERITEIYDTTIKEQLKELGTMKPKERKMTYSPLAIISETKSSITIPFSSSDLSAYYIGWGYTPTRKRILKSDDLKKQLLYATINEFLG